MLIRVRKQDTNTESIINPDGLSYCLDCWKTWMEGDDRDLSASRMKLGAGTDEDERAREAYESDPYADQRKADNKIGEATDAMIESLKRVHAWAIYRKCSVTAQWNFPNTDFLTVLEQAEIDLTRKLKNNIATGTLFCG